MGNHSSRGFTPRDPTNADMRINIEWQWKNNAATVMNAITAYRRGDHQAALNHLVEGQGHNDNVVRDYRTFPDDALNTMMQMYGGQVAGPAKVGPLPWTCTNCGNVLGHCQGGYSGDTHVYVQDASGNAKCPFCPQLSFEISHYHY